MSTGRRATGPAAVDQPDPTTPAVSEEGIERLRALLRLPTVSLDDEVTPTAPTAPEQVAHRRWDAFDDLVDALPSLYPRAHAVLEREVVGGRTLLYRWRGEEDGDPAVLMAHYDVVAAADEGWPHPPFAGVVTGDGDQRVVWGRGAMDMKGVLAAILEAVDVLAGQGRRPRRDVYLSFAHDEEVAGRGTPAVVAELARRGVRPRLVLDEGGAVVEGVLPGVGVPLAVVGVAEKGMATIRLRVRQHGGHAATPPRRTATTRLARAVTRLSRRPHPARLDAPVRQMLTAVAPHARPPFGWLFGHLRWTALPVTFALARLGGTSSALVRTTQAVTQLSGSLAANALAEEATAVVNVRVAPGSSVARAVHHIRRAVRDPAVQVEVVHAAEPSPVSPAHGEAWEVLGAAVAHVFPRAVVVPYVMLQASDARHLTAISDHVYRFMPFDMSAQERDALHARDERIRVTTFAGAVEFFTDLLTRL